MGVGQLIVGKREAGVTFDCLIQQADCLGQAFRFRGTENSCRDKCFGLIVQIMRS